MSRMRILAVCVWVSIWAFLVEVDAQSAPSVEFNETVFDFGRIPQGEAVSHTFTFKNVGDEELEILDIKATCGCTATFLSEEQKRLFPGESGELKTTFHSKGKRGDQQKAITVHTNDPQNPKVKLALVGQVLVYVDSAPPSGNFGQAPRSGRVNPLTVKFFSGDGQPFEITAANPSTPRLGATWAKQADGSILMTIELKQSPGASDPLGLVEDQIVLTTTHPNQPQCIYRVGWTVTKAVVLSAQRLTLVGEAGREGALSLEVSRLNEGSFKIEEILGLPKSVTYQVVELDPGRKYRVDFTLSETASVGRATHKITVKTDDPLSTNLEAEFDIIVHPRPGGGT